MLVFDMLIELMLLVRMWMWLFWNLCRIGCEVLGLNEVVDMLGWCVSVLLIVGWRLCVSFLLEMIEVFWSMLVLFW